MDIGVKDTTAYKIIRQILDHTWGADSELEDEQFLDIFTDFYKRHGSWEELMDGSMQCVKSLEDAIDSHMKSREISKIAAALANSISNE